LIRLLSSCDPRYFGELAGLALGSSLKSVLRFYIPVSKSELARMWARQKHISKSAQQVGLAEDEMVEDAGLESDDALFPSLTRKPKARQPRVVM
jgi:hypothetical protein